jgi:type VI secretion system secreted protein VgrG
MASRKLFSFSVRGQSEDALHVVRFSGREGISQLFEFDLTLLTESATPEDLLARPATLTLHAPAGDLPYSGVIAKLDCLQRYGPYLLYRVLFKPRLFVLTLVKGHRIFLDKTLTEFTAEVLTTAGFAAPEDFEFRCSQNYPSLEFVCQYAESPFDFLSRWFERDGLAYYFEHGAEKERLVVSDTNMAFSALPGLSNFTYAPITGLDDPGRDSVVHSFTITRKLAPQRMLLHDYNYRKPELKLQAKVDVAEHGVGEICAYGEHPHTLDEAKRLAAVRKQEMLCRETLYKGESAAPYFRAGYVFSLDKHFRSDCNQDYLLLSVEHAGAQEAYLSSALGLDVSSGGTQNMGYRCSFTSIPAATPFRPERVTKAPRVCGGVNARIDAAGSGEYAELDEQGRYKVILPFDISGRKDGAASTWLRMAQPYSGSNHGMHFPLLKGTEVLVTFVNGDPDRPVIAAALPNPATPSPVNDASNTQCRITTAAQNKIHFEDKDGGQRIVLQTPTAGTWFRMGSPNDPPAPSVSEGDEEEPFFEKNAEGFAYATEKSWGSYFGGDLGIKIGGNSTTVIVGGYEGIVAGLYNRNIIGLNNEIWIGGWIDLLLSNKIEANVFKTKTAAVEITAHKTKAQAIDKKLKKYTARLEAANKKAKAVNNDMSFSDTRVRMANNDLKLKNEELKAKTADLTAKKTKLDALEEQSGYAASDIAMANTETKAIAKRTETDAQRIATVKSKVSATMDQEDISGVMVSMFDESLL